MSSGDWRARRDATRRRRAWEEGAVVKSQMAYRQVRQTYDGVLAIPLAVYVIRVRGNAWFRLTCDED
jgi:hypothetical protein